MVATLVGPMTSTFSSLKTLSWLGSAYLIASAATQPLSGRLTEIFGRREGAVLCNILFLLGTLVCGLAPNEKILILGRVVAGLGGGALVAISTFVGSDLVPTRKRGVVQGINNIAMGAGSGLGGFFGGSINRILGWRWAFLTQVPFLILGTIMVGLFVKVPLSQSDKSALRRIDYGGISTLIASMTLCQIGLNAGGNLVPWSPPLIPSTLSLSVAALAGLVYIERHIASEPIIPLHLFSFRTVSAACSTYFFAYMANFGILFFIPMYLQICGLSPTQAGIRFIPQSVGTAIGAFVSGLLIRATGTYSVLSATAHVLLIVASASIYTLTEA